MPASDLSARLGAIRASLGLLRRRATIALTRPKVGVYVWLRDNAYHHMLYSAFKGAAEPHPLHFLEELDAFTRLPSQDRTLCIHAEQAYSWGHIGDEARLVANAGRYRAAIERWAAKGGAIAWTLHDSDLHLGDHDRDRFESLRQLLASSAQFVHVHSEAARDYALEELGLPDERVVIVPHPSYALIHPPREKSASAPGAGRRLLAFGHIKRYKDFRGLGEAIAALGPGRFDRLVIAGSRSDPVDIPEDLMRGVLTLDTAYRFIADDEVAGFFAQADALVLPYLSSMTSGAAALSMGFGVPVIAPRLGGMTESVPEENLPLLYDPGDPDGLRDALARLADMPEAAYADLARACSDFGERIHPTRISGELMSQMKSKGVLTV